MRTDPTENGGLFVGRRPGTAPIRYRSLPPRGTARRRAFDNTLAGVILATMALVGLTFWGPLPAAWLWVGSQVDYRTGSVSLGIVCTFVGLMANYLAFLIVMRRLDHVWVLVRRAAGHDQRSGMIGMIFAVCAVVGCVCFFFWLLIIEGPAPSLAPQE